VIITDFCQTNNRRGYSITHFRLTATTRKSLTLLVTNTTTHNNKKTPCYISTWNWFFWWVAVHTLCWVLQWWG